MRVSSIFLARAISWVAGEQRNLAHLGEIHPYRVVDTTTRGLDREFVFNCDHGLIAGGKALLARDNRLFTEGQLARVGLVHHVDARFLEPQENAFQPIRNNRFVRQGVVELFPCEEPLLTPLGDQVADAGLDGIGRFRCFSRGCCAWCLFCAHFCHSCGSAAATFACRPVFPNSRGRQITFEQSRTSLNLDRSGAAIAAPRFDPYSFSQPGNGLTGLIHQLPAGRPGRSFSRARSRSHGRRVNRRLAFRRIRSSRRSAPRNAGDPRKHRFPHVFR